MAGLLTTTVTDAQRQANDRHSVWAVAAVLGVIVVYMYLFTHVYQPLQLPAPQDLAHSLGIEISYVFDEDRNVDSKVYVSFTQRYQNNDDERLVLLFTLVGAFLSAYFLPLALKQASLVVWTTVGICLLFGIPAAAMLLCAHLVVYLTLHPQRQSALLWGAAPGFFIALALGADRAGSTPYAIMLPLLSAGLYQFVWLKLLDSPGVASLLRTLVIQSALITVCVAALSEGIDGVEWKLPLGILYFFWQWERLIMYHTDFKDGLVPETISVWQYLAVFVTPASIPNLPIRPAIGQGYAYINRVFLSEDKNRIVLSGVKILLVALCYLVFGDWIRYALVDLFEGLGLPVFDARIKYLIQAFHGGEELGALSVLMTSLLDLVRWVLIFAAVAHFKVGMWRICGYQVDPSFDKPWLATNLVSFWARFTFHYREFLARAFYYPVFFRFFKRHPMTRVVVATLAAVTVGNLIWGHLAEVFFRHGLEFAGFGSVFVTWPYFVLLGLGIGVTEIYLLKRKRTRKPWTWGPGIITDVIAVYCTLQFYALIHIFAYSRGDATNWELLRLFLTAFGLSLPA